MQPTNTPKNERPTTPTTITAAQIKPDMAVLCSQHGEFATVDHMQGPATIKLKKDKAGVHHYIPLAWVQTVDNELHIDRPGAQAMKEWSDKPPAKA